MARQDRHAPWRPTHRSQARARARLRRRLWPGTKPSDVASFLVEWMCGERNAAEAAMAIANEGASERGTTKGSRLVSSGQLFHPAAHREIACSGLIGRDRSLVFEADLPDPDDLVGIVRRCGADGEHLRSTVPDCLEAALTVCPELIASYGGIGEVRTRTRSRIPGPQLCSRSDLSVPATKARRVAWRQWPFGVSVREPTVQIFRGRTCVCYVRVWVFRGTVVFEARSAVGACGRRGVGDGTVGARDERRTKKSEPSHRLLPTLLVAAPPRKGSGATVRKNRTPPSSATER